jgi:Domain of Unknown Function (DUF1080)
MISQLKATCAAALLASACASTGGGAIDLLAKGLDGFTVANTANWNYADGVMQANAGGAQPSVLVTKDDYQDFELSLEVYVSEDHNSGVFIRCSDRNNIQATNCYEINIFDERPDQSGRTGGAPGFFKPLAHVDAAGKWNTIKIHAEGPHILVVMNGVITIDSDGPLMSNGPIALQWGAGEVMFRNVRVRRL